MIYYLGWRERFAREMQRHQQCPSTTEVLRATWRWYAPKRREPYLRLIGEVYGLAFVNQRRYQGFPTAMTEDDFSIVDAGFRSQVVLHPTLFHSRPNAGRLARK